MTACPRSAACPRSCRATSRPCSSPTSPGLTRHHDAPAYADLDPAYLQRIQTECALFQARHSLLLIGAYDAPRRDPYTETDAGRDFWYDRNGHGTGAWDRNLGLMGDMLAEHARRFQQVDTYITDAMRVAG